MQQSDSQKFVNGKPLSQLLGKNENGGVAWLVKPAGGEICVAKLSDDELYQKCRQYGMNAKVWLRKFAGLLPEVAKRGLHRRKGFISIGEFAGKLAGMSEYAVDKILNLAKNLENKPALRKLFESGAEGWSKIEKVAYISTVETDKDWAAKVVLLSTRALETLVRNTRSKFTHVSEKENINSISQGVVADGGLLPSGGGVVGVVGLPPGASDDFMRFSFPASKDVEFDLRLAKQKLEKQSRQVLSWNETFKMLIQKSESATVKIAPASIGKGILGDDVSGFCSKCHKKTNIRNIQVCNECIKKP